MKINVALFISFLLLSLIIGIFGVYIIVQLDSVSYISQEIREATRISELALDFNAENYHTQLEIWEYAYQPNQERLDAFEQHKVTLNELFLKLEAHVVEEYSNPEEQDALFSTAEDDFEQIASNLKLVQADWVLLITQIGKYEDALNAGVTGAELEKIRDATEQKVISYEKFFDDLEFHKGVNAFVVSQGNLISQLEHEQTELISLFITSLYVIIPIITVIGILIAYVLSRMITSPMMSLYHATNKISKNDFNINLNTTGAVSEISSLSNSFQNMSDTIHQNETSKNEFISMITHELKTPLVPIQGYCELFKKNMLGHLDEKQQYAIDNIYDSSSELLHLVNNLLSAQKLEMNKMVFNMDVIPLLSFTQNIHKILQPIMLEKQIQFANTTNKNISVIADHDKLKEIFTNLIQNSVDFVPEKNGKIEFGIFDETEKEVTLYVKDNGQGMSEDDQKKLFMKFWQSNTSVSRKHGGTGLGLSICKGYVDGMNGKIWLKSVKNAETIVYFTLPIAVDNDLKEIN